MAAGSSYCGSETEENFLRSEALPTTCPSDVQKVYLVDLRSAIALTRVLPV